MHEKVWENTQLTAIKIVYVAIYTWLTWGLMGFGLNYAAGKAAHYYRILYLKKSLEKDAAYYDINNASSMAAKIQKEVAII